MWGLQFNESLKNWSPQTTVQRVENARQESTGGMQQCQNHWQAWHILQCAQSSRSDRKEEKFGEKSGNLRSRCGFARTQAFWHGWRGIFCRARSGLQHDCLDMFTKRDTETQPHRHTETRTQALFLTASARHCPCPGCKSLLGHGPAPARELVCTVQAPAARCAPKSNVLETRTLLWFRHGCS